MNTYTKWTSFFPAAHAPFSVNNFPRWQFFELITLIPIFILFFLAFSLPSQPPIPLITVPPYLPLIFIPSLSPLIFPGFFTPYHHLRPLFSSSPHRHPNHSMIQMWTPTLLVSRCACSHVCLLTAIETVEFFVLRNNRKSVRLSCIEC